MPAVMRCKAHGKPRGGDIASKRKGMLGVGKWIYIYIAHVSKVNSKRLDEESACVCMNGQIGR